MPRVWGTSFGMPLRVRAMTCASCAPFRIGLFDISSTRSRAWRKLRASGVKFSNIRLTWSGQYENQERARKRLQIVNLKTQIWRMLLAHTLGGLVSIGLVARNKGG